MSDFRFLGSCFLALGSLPKLSFRTIVRNLDTCDKLVLSVTKFVRFNHEPVVVNLLRLLLVF